MVKIIIVTDEKQCNHEEMCKRLHEVPDDPLSDYKCKNEQCSPIIYTLAQRADKLERLLEAILTCSHKHEEDTALKKRVIDRVGPVGHLELDERYVHIFDVSIDNAAALITREHKLAGSSSPCIALDSWSVRLNFCREPLPTNFVREVVDGIRFLRALSSAMRHLPPRQTFVSSAEGYTNGCVMQRTYDKAEEVLEALTAEGVEITECIKGWVNDACYDQHHNCSWITDDAGRMQTAFRTSTRTPSGSCRRR